MKTFFDEAGIFIDPQHSNAHKVSVVGSLVIPDCSYKEVINSFLQLKLEWGVKGEIKGNKLTEDQVNCLVEDLEKHNVLFNAVIIDSKFLNPSIISKHKKHYAKEILKNISSFHHPNVKNQIKKLSATIFEISDQLYLQNLAMTSLVNRSHQFATLFYVQRTPNELAKFEWIIDAKQKEITKSEKWWKDILKPTLQYMGIMNPMIMLKGADYSNYSQFDDDEHPEFGSLNKIFKNLEFRDSFSEEGLQLVDICTTSLRKALNNKFKIEGWRGISKLMIHMRDQNLFSIILGGDIPNLKSLPYYHVIDTLNKEARSCIL